MVFLPVGKSVREFPASPEAMATLMRNHGAACVILTNTTQITTTLITHVCCRSNPQSKQTQELSLATDAKIDETKYKSEFSVNLGMPFGRQAYIMFLRTLLVLVLACKRETNASPIHSERNRTIAEVEKLGALLSRLTEDVGTYDALILMDF